jgi:Pvc16 N-terminal domain
MGAKSHHDAVTQAMINPLDDLLRDLIQSRIPALAGATQVGFAPPNADWKAAVVAAAEERVNLYLYDLRENTRLRTNDRDRRPRNSGYVETSPSPRLDCTYLVTAWSPVTFTAALDPAREEHALLYKVAAVLMHARPLVAAEVFTKPIPSLNTLAAVPAELKTFPLPLSVALPDAVKEPTEFWTTMKVDWKPALHLTVTIPVTLDEPEFLAPAVTTLTGIYAQAGVALATERVVSVGGRVLQGVGATPVGGAKVTIAGVTPPAVATIRKVAVTGSDGRFVFSPMAAGQYTIDAVWGTKLKTITVEIPSPSGEYDVIFP